MINLQILNRGLYGELTPSEFETLYIIANGLAHQGSNDFKRYTNEWLAERSGLSERQIIRITRSLEDKGFIESCTKNLSKVKKVKFYRLDLDILNKPTEYEQTPCMDEKNNKFIPVEDDFPF